MRGHLAVVVEDVPEPAVVRRGRWRGPSGCAAGRALSAPRGSYCAMASGHAEQAARRNVGWLIRKYLTYLPLVGFLVTLAIALAVGVDDWKVTALEVGLVWLVGVSGILLGSPHLFTPRPVAEAIGWPTSPFQWEVGLAAVGTELQA
jgi:Family of unknown function (DUF6790)